MPIAGRLYAHVHEHSATIKELAVHPDGRHVASCSFDGTVKLWDGHQLCSDVALFRSVRTQVAHTLINGGDAKCRLGT